MTPIIASSVVVITLFSAAVTATSDVQTMTGWFADAQCAAPRVAKNIIGPNNADCVKRCLEKGVAPVFVSEQARALFEVKEYASVAADVGYHVEVTGVIDNAGKTITVRSVKRLSSGSAFCALPPKEGGTKK